MPDAYRIDLPLTLADHLFYEEPGITLYAGDALAVLRELPEASAQMCITSPPYWGLRDYGTATWEGGDERCDHKGSPVRTQAGVNARHFGKKFKTDKQGDEREPMRQTCTKCGARRIDAQIGLEPTPDCGKRGAACGECYVCHMVEVFREVRRVLRDDGTLFLNLGDSYAAGGQNSGSRPEDLTEKQRSNAGCRYERRSAPPGLKPKDLVGIPWRTAFALQADGWYLRSDIIWAKPNPMPESVIDRPTKSHEYLFLLSKSATYYYDAEAIKEKASEATHARISQNLASQVGSFRANGGNKTNGPMRAVMAGTTRKIAEQGSGIKNNRSFEGAMALTVARVNKRSVWTIATQPFSGAHFATFPPDLVKPCVLAGSRPGDVVLDHFVGSGTVPHVAKELGRAAIGIDLSPDYLALAVKRLRQGVLAL